MLNGAFFMFTFHVIYINLMQLLAVVGERRRFPAREKEGLVNKEGIL